MAYNYGPDYSYANEESEDCPHCGENVFMIWDGHEGCWMCPNCLTDLEEDE